MRKQKAQELNLFPAPAAPTVPAGKPGTKSRKLVEVRDGAGNLKAIKTDGPEGGLLTMLEIGRNDYAKPAAETAPAKKKTAKKVAVPAAPVAEPKKKEKQLQSLSKLIKALEAEKIKVISEKVKDLKTIPEGVAVVVGVFVWIRPPKKAADKMALFAKIKKLGFNVANTKTDPKCGYYYYNTSDVAFGSRTRSVKELAKMYA